MWLKITIIAYNGVDIQIVLNRFLEKLVENKFRIISKFRDANSQEAIPGHEVNKNLSKVDPEL
jgi:polyhydroxyalkanoate synthesis regulator protein